MEIKFKKKEKSTISRFIESQAIPGQYVNIIWKIYLNVLPKYRDSWNFIETQQQEEYEDLFNASFCSKDSKRVQQIIEIVDVLSFL
jgi:hypothetical protein